MNSKPSINDFVEHRWADAKEELRKLDPDFVRRVEETVRLQGLGLEALGVGGITKQRLSKKWHTLLEDCDELVRKASILQTAIDCFTADSNGEMSSVEVGRRFFYHMRSWFIHTQALAEQTQRVISNTTSCYISDREVDKELSKCHRKSVKSQVVRTVKQERDDFAHATAKSWSTNITKDNLWEPSVAAGLTPQKSHNESIYVFFGERVKSGMYHHPLAEKNGIVFQRLGGILHQLEEDIDVHNAQVDFQSIEGER